MARMTRKVRLIAVRVLLSYPTAHLSGPVRRSLRSLRQVITTCLRQRPNMLLDAIGNPDVCCPLLVLHTGVGGVDADGMFRKLVPALLATLAPRHNHGALSDGVLWDVSVDTLVDCYGRRTVQFSPPSKGLWANPTGLEVATHDGTKVRLPPAPELPESGPQFTADCPFHGLTDDLPHLHLSTIDTNPLSHYEAHPDKQGNAITLGDKPLEEWITSYQQALELIKLGVPTWYEEAKVTMKRLVPVGYMRERHESATYREAPSVAYVTLCENPLTLAEAMIHETQHTKVNLASWLDPIVHNAHTCWTESPVRPDLRPLWGVLLAVHAFVPVSAMHQRLLDLDHPVTHTERFPRRQAEVLAGNDRGMRAVLESSQPTSLGRRLIDEMATLHQHLMEVAPPPPDGIDKDLLPPS